MNFKFSGHETFPCRYAWLPKAYAALCDDEHAFSDEDEAMVRLGVGKNMARAARFWVHAAGIAEPVSDRRGGHRVTAFGHALLSSRGLDPYLEDRRTLWLLHWKLSTLKEPMFAWYFLLNQWQHPELSRTEVMREFRAHAQKQPRPLSDVTLEQHLDIFLHTYTPTRGRKGEIAEDNLDCPLNELRLLTAVGKRRFDEVGRDETVYAFRREDKPDITGPLLAYCLHDFWRARRRHEATLPFRDVCAVEGSVGQIFKLPEAALRDRLETLVADSDGRMEYEPSAAAPRVVRRYEVGDSEVEATLLTAIYEKSADDYFAVQPQPEQETLCLQI